MKLATPHPQHSRLLDIAMAWQLASEEQRQDIEQELDRAWQTFTEWRAANTAARIRNKQGRVVRVLRRRDTDNNVQQLTSWHTFG